MARWGLPVERLIAEGCVDPRTQLSNENNTGCLGYIVTYYPVIGDYNQPL